MSDSHKTRRAAVWERCCLIILAGALLAGCGGEVALPPAQPLTATADQLRQIPSIDAGPWQVVTADAVVLPRTALYRELPLRVLYPAAQETHAPFPVLVFSHGNFSDRQHYDAVLGHWVSHGYVVIAPTHLDGGGMPRGIFNSLRHGQMGLISARIDDVRHILGNLPEIAAQIADPRLRMDVTRIALTGHSFGAFTAQQFIGAAAIDDDFVLSARDSRVLVAVALSPPGPMFDVINENSWDKVSKPMLITTGTWDVNAQFWPHWEQHMVSHRFAPTGNKVALVVDGMDHYLGNLICRPERDAVPQTDALRMVNAVSTSFLNAWLKGDVEAELFLESDRLRQLTGGFARLQAR